MKRYITIVLSLAILIGGGVFIKKGFENWASKNMLGVTPQEFKQIKEEAEQKFHYQMEIYAFVGTSEDSLFKFKSFLESQNTIQSVQYLSAEQNLANYIERNKNDSTALKKLEEINDNPFGAIFTITVVDPNMKQAIVNAVRANDPFSVVESIRASNTIDPKFDVKSE